jgi:hypothetical protein
LTSLFDINFKRDDSLPFEEKIGKIWGRFAATGVILRNGISYGESNITDIIDINRKPRIKASLITSIYDCVDIKISTDY